MSKYKTTLVLFSLLIYGATFAAPAAWFQWRSKLDSVLVCSQTTPGEGWEKFNGPYHDARCEKLKIATTVVAGQLK